MWPARCLVITVNEVKYLIYLTTGQCLGVEVNTFAREIQRKTVLVYFCHQQDILCVIFVIFVIFVISTKQITFIFANTWWGFWWTERRTNQYHGECLPAAQHPPSSKLNFKGGVRWLFLCLLLQLAGRMFRESLLGNGEKMAPKKRQVGRVKCVLCFIEFDILCNYREQIISNKLLKSLSLSVWRYDGEGPSSPDKWVTYESVCAVCDQLAPHSCCRSENLVRIWWLESGENFLFKFQVFVGNNLK